MTPTDIAILIASLAVYAFSVLGALVVGFGLCYLLTRSVRVENTELRTLLFRKTGYAPIARKTTTETQEREGAKEKKHYNMKMPRMDAMAQLEPPDLFRSKREALAMDADAVKNGKPAAADEL